MRKQFLPEDVKRRQRTAERRWEDNIKMELKGADGRTIGKWS
jgi:hypothetical protein